MTRKQLLLLLLLTAGAVLVHGYHPAAEDSEIYLPAIKKDLNSALYPFGAEFFMYRARMSLFAQLISSSVRLSHLPLSAALILWHLLSIFLFLLGCWYVTGKCFRDASSRWGGVVLVAALLTIPVAGTALYLMDPYLNPRSLSTPALLFAILNTLEKKYVRASLWTLFAAAIHPLMTLLALPYMVLLLASKPHVPTALRISMLLPLGFSFGPVSEAYRQSLPSYYFVLRWRWYEWLGLFGPLVLLWWIRRIAQTRRLLTLELLSGALIPFQLLFFAASLVTTLLWEGLAAFQLMRSLHITYIFLFLFLGGLLAEWVLKNQAWRWLLLFVPLCGGMSYAQRALFPATPQIEWPGATPATPWLKAFAWIRANTLENAIFAVDPDYMRVPGENWQGFRALAERSRLADNVSDASAVTTNPSLAEEWYAQRRSLQGWKTFNVADFRQLHQRYGVTWILLEHPGVPGLICPYQNGLLVCRIE